MMQLVVIAVQKQALRTRGRCISTGRAWKPDVEEVNNDPRKRTGEEYEI
jgi:hypothetical protein